MLECICLTRDSPVSTKARTWVPSFAGRSNDADGDEGRQRSVAVAGRVGGGEPPGDCPDREIASSKKFRTAQVHIVEFDSFEADLFGVFPGRDEYSVQLAEVFVTRNEEGKCVAFSTDGYLSNSAGG
jgi:hypothetical protein